MRAMVQRLLRTSVLLAHKVQPTATDILGFIALFPFVPLLSVAEELWAGVRGIEIDQRLRLQAVRVAVAKELTAWTDDVVEALSKADFTPRDYNPPRYPGAANASAEAKAVSQRSAVSGKSSSVRCLAL